MRSGIVTEILYICLIGDDIWKPDKVEKVNYAFSNPEVKAVLHDAEIVDENGVATGAASLFL